MRRGCSHPFLFISLLFAAIHGGRAAALDAAAAKARGNAALARGEFAAAREEFAAVARDNPLDREAWREAGRAAKAAGDLRFAVYALLRAEELGSGMRDGELHYLRAEALEQLGEKVDASLERDLAALALGPWPVGRRERLWRARIYALQGDLDSADVLYRRLAPLGSPPDAEVALAQGESHALRGDFAGAERILTVYLGRGAQDRHARRLLAWALEAQGKVSEELALREDLAREDAEDAVDYGRALERSGDARAALSVYSGVRGDTVAIRETERLRALVGPQASVGISTSSDPNATSVRATASASLGVGSRHRASFVASSDSALGAPAVTSMRIWATLRDRRGDEFAVGPSFVDTTPAGGGPAVGGLGAFVAELPLRLRLDLRGGFNALWAEAPTAVREGGLETGGVGHLYARFGDRAVIDVGGQARRLTLSGDAWADLAMLFGGFDLVLASNPTSALAGCERDDVLATPVIFADSAIFTFRHYEARADARPAFSRRVGLAPKVRIDDAGLTLRKTWRGVLGAELGGGVGWDSARELLVTRVAAVGYVAAGGAGRVELGFDHASESSPGVLGQRRMFSVSYHASF